MLIEAITGEEVSKIIVLVIVEVLPALSVAVTIIVFSPLVKVTALLKLSPHDGAI